MKVYSVKLDVNHFQFFLTKQESEWSALSMDCTSRASTWSPPSVYIHNSKLRRGDFFNFNVDCLIADLKAVQVLQGYFESSGELLPLPHNREMYFVANVTSCVDCLDQSSCEWSYYEDEGIRKPLSLVKYAFDPARIPATPLFKIPEERTGFIFTAEVSSGEGFKHAVDSSGLLGLVFDEVWSTE